MKKLLASILLGSLTIVQSQFITESDFDLADGDLMKTLNNYFGCRKWQDGVCLQCSQRYYFNKNGVCCEVKPECREFNTQQGVCQGCYQGYKLNNGKCVQLNSNDINLQGCSRRQNGKCVQCSKRWFVTHEGVCSPVSDYCRTWSFNGKCQSCYNGYRLNKGDCQLDQSFNNFPLSNPLCATWDNKICLRCSERSFKDSTGKCTQVRPECNTWDKLTGNCLSCFKGYQLANNACIRSQQTGPKDLGCSTWDWDKQICLSCSPRYVKINGVCISVNDSCSTWNKQGLCCGCYKGYSLWNGVCVRAEQEVKDQGCKIWDWDRQICLQCSFRYVARNGRCISVKDSCSSWNQQGLCKTCFKGYNLSNGICVLSQQTGPKDEGCKRWDWDKQICLECSPRFFMKNGICSRVDDLCFSWNKEGVCISCFKGYSLIEGVCTRVEQLGPKDKGCRKWDWDNHICLECSQRFVQKNKICVEVNPNCQTWNNQGACTSCYKGYILSNGQCVLSNFSCKTTNSNGQCSSCYTGYVLYKKDCVVFSKIANLAAYYAECCPEKLAALRAEGRI